MAGTRQILFIQGGGAGAHDEWDDKLFDSLKRELRAIVLIAAPFVGAGGWPGDEFELPHNLGARLPQGVPVHVFHGLQDETAPPSHADLYARAIPHAQLHRLPGRDHQLDNDLSEVAKTISPNDLGPVTRA